MNQIVIGPETDIIIPAVAAEPELDRELFVVPGLEAIKAADLSERPTPGVMSETRARAHWRQVSFLNDQIDRPGMVPQQAESHRQQLKTHLQALGVVELADAA